MSERWLAIETHGPAEPSMALLRALHGLRSASPFLGADFPAASDDEATVQIDFIGLSPDEQQKALASFPGGARFRLRQLDQPAA
ncbi:MAG TPA: hypothetical protein VGO70_04990 [Arsenicitalea sp.]|jgi:hypothetical protein|nr:hypothetical protein [Arsenicitalea sp.]